MKRLLIIVIISIATILAFAGWLHWESVTYDNRMQACGYELMDSIDAYYKIHHQLPRFNEDSFEYKGKRFIYDILRDSTSYYIGYVSDFDKTITCLSTTRKWSDKSVITANGLYLETLDEIYWNNDSCGCLHERNGIMADAIISEYSLIGKDTTEFLRHFGPYNFRNQYSDGFCYGYYINSMCQDGQMVEGADKTKLIFWFNSEGNLTDDGSDIVIVE